MPRPSKIAQSPPAAVQEALQRLGRKLPQQALAQRIGVSRFVVADIEKGKATTGIAAYMGALWALGLLAHMRDIADPEHDEEGKTLERARSPKTARNCRSLSDEF